jgi:hypothetical protein
MKCDLDYNLRVLLCAGMAGLALACGSSGNDEPGTTNGGTTGGGTVGIPIMPTEDGWVDMTSNELGIQGAWYPYGDAYGEAKCIAAGWTAEQCSIITTPDPNAEGFPNTGGAMCTSGTGAQVLTPEGSSDPDYGNMWGSGIGLDLNNPGDGATKSEFNATANGVVGISFDLDVQAPLRVEFPMTATEGHPDGSNYWGATSSWPNSPVTVGTNTVLFSDVHHPNGAVPLDPANVSILSIQFHVPTVTSGAQPYSFCISNLVMLKAAP